MINYIHVDVIMKLKRGNNKNRGYCGWHTTKYNNKVFLRSKIEFIYAKYLDSKNLNYKTEFKIYNINGINYKPDFFIWNDKNNFSIVEIKYNKKEAERYEKLFHKYFLNKGIDYKVVYNGFNKIIKDLHLEKDIENYILSNEYNKKIGYKGKENPNFGNIFTTETRKKIGDATIKRMNNKVWKKEWLKIMQQVNTSESYKKKIKIRDEKLLKKRNKNDPFEKRKCLFCNKIFKVRLSSKQKFCKQSCAARYNLKIMHINNTGRIKTNEEKIKNYKSRVINLLLKSKTFLKEIKNIKTEEELDNLLYKCYSKKEIKKNQPHKKESIMKCFDNIKQLKEEVTNC